jgi:threonine dehydrogenase-like Zn-dependent dehydrogenase
LVQERLDRTASILQEKARNKGVHLLCVRGDQLTATVKEESQNRGADDIILAVGINSVQQNALSLLAPVTGVNYKFPLTTIIFTVIYP